MKNIFTEKDFYRFANALKQSSKTIDKMKAWQFWKWPKMFSKLNRIRTISSRYFNDSKMTAITRIIDE